jgi:hypothetical protein
MRLTDAAPSTRRASPSARRRSRRRTTGGGRRGRAARSALCHPALPSGSIARRHRATGVQAARRHPGEVGADGPRAAGERPDWQPGAGRPEARYAAQPGPPEVSAGATAPRACWPRVAIPVKWRLADAAGSRRNGAPATGRQRTNHGGGPFPAAHPHPRAGGRGEGLRVAGAGRPCVRPHNSPGGGNGQVSGGPCRCRIFARRGGFPRLRCGFAPGRILCGGGFF